MKPSVVAWVAGLVAGLLLRSAGSAHGLLSSLVVVATSAAAAGYAWRLAQTRPPMGLPANRRVAPPQYPALDGDWTTRARYLAQQVRAYAGAATRAEREAADLLLERVNQETKETDR